MSNTQEKVREAIGRVEQLVKANWEKYPGMREGFRGPWPSTSQRANRAGGGRPQQSDVPQTNWFIDWERDNDR